MTSKGENAKEDVSTLATAEDTYALHDDGGSIVSEEGEAIEGICIYGDMSKKHWGGKWSRKIVSSKVFKVGVVCVNANK